VNAPRLIGPYDAPGALKVVDLRPWDARGPAAANGVMRLLQTALPSIVVEHVGSTSVPHCDGKGILDLLLLIPVGHLNEVCATVDGMGFQHQSGGIKHPDNRPMRICYGSSVIDLLQILNWSHFMLSKNVVSSTLRFRIVQHTLRVSRPLFSRCLNWKNSGIE
jgi:GrpB-like predicted nucleotidyltransferase (UPF0157 family)